MDRISTLPNDILDLILERLPLIDKVRTSALSKIWKLRWRLHPSLIMDEDFCFSVHIDGCALARVVKSVVSQHSGCIREFSLFIPCENELGPTSLSIYLDAISSALNGCASSLERLILEGLDEEGLLLPPSIFSLVNLRHLEIKRFQFQPPSCFEGFPKLTLFLLESETTTSEALSRFISVCPQLETVNLEHLGFLGFWGQNIDLNAPHLSHLYVGGYYNDIFVSNAQNLDSISLNSECRLFELDGISEDSFRILSSTTHLKHISLNGAFCELLGHCTVIRRLPKYGLMRSLEFKDVVLNQRDQLQCVLSLLAASSSNIRKLKLNTAIMIPFQEEALELYESTIEKFINADFEHLVRVDLSGIAGGKIQMKIIELLLHFSPLLKIMHIKLYVKKELKLKEAITKFYRASTKARLEFSNIEFSMGRTIF